jgi:hypothetical protein
MRPFPEASLLMNIDHLGIRPKPEEEELALKKRELQDLESRLIESELQLASLNGEIATFERLYLKIAGVRYAELDEIEARIAELLASIAPTDLEAEGKAQEARARADESRMGTTDLVLEETKRFSPSSSLKSLYREVARRIHPDLAVDDADRAKRQKLMTEANRAYQLGDEKKLLAILEEYESSPESVAGEGPGIELVKVIRKIAQVRRRLAEIDSETREAMASELFRLKKKVDDGTRLGRDVLSEMASAVNLRIDEKRAALRKLRSEAK